jgi:hypothetical protein
MALALLTPAAASAALTDDVVAAADPGAVTEAATKALPGLPVPVETPDLPKVPLPPPPPSAPKMASPSAVTEPAEATVRDLGGGAGEGVPAAAPGTERPAAPSDPGAGGEPDAQAVSQGSDRRPIDPVETAPVRRWRAYVWPAIALRFGDALAPLLSRLDGLVPAEMPDVVSLLSPPAASGPADVDRPARRSGLLGQNLQSPSGPSLPAGGMGLLAALLIGLLMAVCLVSLARLVVGEELFEASHWRGHRH